jgi:hypothetical protein
VEAEGIISFQRCLGHENDETLVQQSVLVLVEFAVRIFNQSENEKSSSRSGCTGTENQDQLGTSSGTGSFRAVCPCGQIVSTPNQNDHSSERGASSPHVPARYCILMKLCIARATPAKAMILSPDCVKVRDLYSLMTRSHVRRKDTSSGASPESLTTDCWETMSSKTARFRSPGVSQTPSHSSRAPHEHSQIRF